MNKPNLDSINLSKVKKLKGTGIRVEWDWKESAKDSEEVHSFDMKLSSTRPVHKDMHSLFDELKGMLATCYDYDKIKKDSDYDEVLNCIEITGASFSGSDEKRGAIITAKFETKSGKYVALNSERLVYTQNVFGHEERLGEIEALLKHEVYEYLYKNKVGKLAKLEIGV